MPAVVDLRDSEIEDLDERRAVRAATEEEVRRLEVSMNDARRMRLSKRLARLKDVVDRICYRQPPFPLQERPEILSFEKLHHDVRCAVRQLGDVKNATHVLAAHLGRRPRLLEK